MNRYTPILLTAGLVVWLEGLITVEWTYAYCLSQSDGPAYASQGFPLPYWMWNGVASLEHDFLPHVYILNIVVLSLLLFPFVNWIWKKLFAKTPAWLRGMIGGLGAFLLLAHVTLTILMISIGYFRPTTSLGLDSYHSYTEFRPVRIGLKRSNAPACTPSQFWFPNGWQHN